MKHYLSLERSISNKLTSTDTCALLMGIVFFIILVLLYQGNKTVVNNLIEEDGLIENLSALFWLEASIICFYRIATYSQRNKFLLYFWGIFCLLCFGEEISWGQRIFLYTVHSVQSISAQNEFNMHNINILSAPLGMSSFIKHGSNITWKGFLNAQNLFYLGFVIYFLLIPLVNKFKKVKLLKHKLHYQTPSFYFLISIWPIIILSFILSLYSEKFRAMIEIREMFMAFVVLFYVSFYLSRENRLLAVKLSEAQD
jgi:hypothetical protein